MNIDPKDYRVEPERKVALSEWPTRTRRVYRSKEHYESLLGEHTAQLAQLQDVLYASNQYALLLIFQAMDAAGKDGAIKHVMSGVNPQGCQVYSFKQPTHEELEHDFLWRTNRRLPERGHIGIFNRSYYEEVLVVRVHPELLEAERLPKEALKIKHFWQHRYRSIVELEAHLDRSGTRIVKVFLHLSQREQTRRLLERIDDPNKNWKFSDSDLRERRLWGKYMQAYEACLSGTSTESAPWYIVPADDKENARLIVSGIILETLRDLRLSYPKLGPAQRAELHKLRHRLVR